MSLGTFTRRLLVITALATALWQLTDILILLLGAILFTVGICAAVRLVGQEHCVARALCVLGAALWVFGSTIAAQMDDVIQAAPAGLKLFMAWGLQSNTCVESAATTGSNPRKWA
jgi:hypothetical protein